MCKILVVIIIMLLVIPYNIFALEPETKGNVVITKTVQLDSEKADKIKVVLERALSFAEDIKDASLKDNKRVKVMYDIIRGFIKIGKVDRALDVLDRLYIVNPRPMSVKKASDETNRAKQMRNEGYDFIAKELAEVGDFERALLVAEKLDDEAVKSQTLSAIVAKQTISNPEKALAVLEKIQDDKVRFQALSTLAIEQAKTDADAAMKIAKKIDDIDLKAKTVASIVDIIAETDLNEALDFIKTIDDATCKRRAASSLAIKQAKVDADLALSLIQELDTPSAKMYTLSRIAEEVSAKDIDKAVSIAEMIDDSIIKSQTLSNISLKALSPPKEDSVKTK